MSAVSALCLQTGLVWESGSYGGDRTAPTSAIYMTEARYEKNKSAVKKIKVAMKRFKFAVKI